ncbi:MAG: hypothetical protein D9N11_12125 [Ketobacter sp.]|nr:MAG: hypothetical protein D9N11_12125 [Ketobacter sp.]
MDSNRTISLHGFRDTDETVFCSLLSLLSFKTNAVWEVVEDETCDVTVVDVDSNQGLSLAETMENNGRRVIRFGQLSSMDAAGEMCLQKPLRAANILKCLNSLNQGDSSGHGEQTAVPAVEESLKEEAVTGFRLRRWPCQEILNAYPGSSRLCALLMKEALTIEQTVERSGMAADIVWDFVNACQQRNFIVEQSIMIRARDRSEHKPANAGLFAMLRSRFGSRG